MTDLSLTDAELNAAVSSEVCGYEIVMPASPHPDTWAGAAHIRKPNDDKKWIECEPLPDYANDFRAMGEVIAAMKAKGWNVILQAWADQKNPLAKCEFWRHRIKGNPLTLQLFTALGVDFPRAVPKRR